MDGHFTGYASLFGVPDLGSDVVEPGAFTASLVRRGAGGVRMLWQHDPAEPIGRWLSLSEDARGLRVAGRLNLGVQRGREIAALVGDGSIDGLSIGFRTVSARRGRDALRHLLAVDLWEISLVTFPLQTGARTAPVPALPLAAEIRSLARGMMPRAGPPSRRPATRPPAALRA